MHLAFPEGRQPSREQHLRIGRRRPVAQHAHVGHVVVDQEPRPGITGPRDVGQHAARRFHPVLWLCGGGIKRRAQVDEAGLDAAVGPGCRLALGVEPPDAGIDVVLRRLERVLARERRFADAAKAVHGDGLRHRRHFALRQRRVDLRNRLAAAGEARRRLDGIVRQRPGLPPVAPDDLRQGSAGTRRGSTEDDVAQQRLLAAEPDEVDIGQRLQQPGRRTFGDAHDDELGLPVERVVGDRVLPLGRAVVALEIVVGKQRDRPRLVSQRIVHRRHEAGVDDVAVLHDDVVAGALEDAGDLHRPLGIRPGAADEEVRVPEARRINRCFRPCVQTGVPVASLAGGIQRRRAA